MTLTRDDIKRLTYWSDEHYPYENGKIICNEQIDNEYFVKSSKVADELCLILAKDGSNKDGRISEPQRLMNIRSYISETIQTLRGNK